MKPPETEAFLSTNRPSLAAVLLLAAFPAVAQSFNVEMIPGIVNTSGLNNTRFVSDVAVTNTGPNDAFLAISFVPGGLPPQVLALPTGATVVWRNVLQELWDSSGVGALSIVSDQKLILRARTYNTAPGGTYGVALPVYDANGFLLPGGTAHSLWVSQSADGTTGYRTNVAVLFPDADGGEATVTVYDADGRSLGQKDFSLDAAGFQQFSVGSFATASPIARAQVDVIRGHAAAYSVVVDNVTGDSSLFTFESLPGGIQDVLVNGVARANGRNSTFFRTDGRFFNPSASDATVTVAFHANQSANPSPTTRDFTVPAGKVLDVVDVLASLLDLPVGSAGALRFTSDSAVAILCRTSNVDPTGARPGTFGAQQKPVPLLSFLSSADAGAVITGIRQNASFRTNVGFAAGDAGAAWTATLKSKTGVALASAPGGLGLFGWTQPNVQDLFPTIPIPDDAVLEVKVTAGSVNVFDSSIDNVSGDPVVTPIAFLPVDVPASATIGAAGGSVRSSDGLLTLKIPAGALSSPAAVSIAPVQGLAVPEDGAPAYQILPDGLAFSRDALLVRTYGVQELTDPIPDALGLAISGGTSWYGLMGGSFDVSRRTLTVPVTSLAAPTAAVRSTLAGSGAVVSTYHSYLISPDSKNVVEGSGTGITFTFYLRTITLSSTGGGKGKPVFLSSLEPWAAAWTVDGASIPMGRTILVPVPACSPLHIIKITAKGGAPRFHLAVATLKVYPRNWKLRVEQTLSIEKCENPHVQDTPRFKSGTILEQGFTLGDDLKFRMTSGGAGYVIRPFEPVLCPYTGNECHYTQFTMGTIKDPGSFQSITGTAEGPGAVIDAQFSRQPVPSFTWSVPSCKESPGARNFPGLASAPSSDQWVFFDFNYHPQTAEAPFVGIPDVLSTQSFTVSIDPASSPSCPR